METGTETTHQVCGNLQGFLVPSPGEQGIEPGLPGHPFHGKICRWQFSEILEYSCSAFWQIIVK